MSKAVRRRPRPHADAALRPRRPVLCGAVVRLTQLGVYWLIINVIKQYLQAFARTALPQNVISALSGIHPSATGTDLPSSFSSPPSSSFAAATATAVAVTNPISSVSSASFSTHSCAPSALSWWPKRLWVVAGI
jgi:hypothetical protein